ncbi:MAG: DNA internalization-related competence protein ComEC/Rec2 [Eggerthellaceae bacterium]|nr:DNA internalization-related competence protein ComEC/Rec2 [Eggerthellaceae bacterium]
MIFWAACAWAYSSGALLDGESFGWAIPTLLAALLPCIVLVVVRMTRLAGLMALSVMVGALLGCSQAALVHAGSDQFETVGNELAELVLLEDSVDYGFGETALVSATIGENLPMAFSARLGDCGPLLSGQHVQARVSFKAIDFAEDGYAWNDGACGQLTAQEVTHVGASPAIDALISVRERTIEAIGAQDDSHALLQALVCGYRRNIRDSELYAQFQACGLAHLVAVSGAHLVIVTGLIAALLKRMRVPRKASISLLVVSMLAYYIVAGMPVSALRATVMSALGLTAYFGKRRPSSLNAVGIGLFGIIATSPTSSVSASLALSALSTIGIVLFAPLFSAWLESAPVRLPSFVLDALSLTLSAGMLSQLYACSLFNQLPLVSPLANIVSAPFFPVVCGLGLVSGLGEAVVAGPFSMLGGAAGFVANLLAWLVSALARIPFASVPFTIDANVALVVSAVVAIALWALWPSLSKRTFIPAAAIAIALTVALVLPIGQDERIVMLDVGQGDAILIQSRGQSMLIDTGNKDSKLQRELALNRIIHLDSILITHADDDHCGSLDQVRKSVDVTRIIVASDMLTCGDDSARNLTEQAKLTAGNVVGVEQGDAFAIGAFTARVVWPKSFTEEGGNADSLCVVLEYDGNDDGVVDCTALMTGDAEKDELKSMIEGGLVGDIDLLKVGHHGSRNGMTEDEARCLKPEISLISCGLHNRYGHPNQGIIDMLEGVGSRVFRTDLDGEVTCRISPEAISVTCTNGERK